VKNLPTIIWTVEMKPTVLHPDKARIFGHTDAPDMYWQAWTAVKDVATGEISDIERAHWTLQGRV
jgi:hypothetical protein